MPEEESSLQRQIYDYSIYGMDPESAHQEAQSQGISTGDPDSDAHHFRETAESLVQGHETLRERGHDEFEDLRRLGFGW